jgi:hypothetical protein
LRFFFSIGWFDVSTRGTKNAYKLAWTKRRRLFRKRQGSSTKRLKSILSDIGVFRTLVNFTSAWITLENRPNHKWLCVELRTINQQKPSSGAMGSTFWRTFKQRLRIKITNTSNQFERWWSRHWIAEPWGNRRAVFIAAELLKNGRPNLVDP